MEPQCVSLEDLIVYFEGSLKNNGYTIVNTDDGIILECPNRGISLNATIAFDILMHAISNCDYKGSITFIQNGITVTMKNDNKQ